MPPMHAAVRVSNPQSLTHNFYVAYRDGVSLCRRLWLQRQMRHQNVIWLEAGMRGCGLFARIGPVASCTRPCCNLHDGFPGAALPSYDGKFCFATFPPWCSVHMCMAPEAMGKRSMCGSDPAQILASMGQFNLLIEATRVHAMQ